MLFSPDIVSFKSRKDLKREPGFDPITFTFSENSNYGRERCKVKKLLGVVNKLLKTKSSLRIPSNVLPFCHKQTFPPIIWIFTEGDEIKSRLPFKIFSTLAAGSLINLKTVLIYPLSAMICHFPFPNFFACDTCFSTPWIFINVQMANRHRVERFLLTANPLLCYFGQLFILPSGGRIWH